MIRKAVTVFFLIGLIVSAGLFATSVWYRFSYIPGSLRFRASLHSGILWITWPDQPYPRLRREDALLYLEHMSIPPGTSIPRLRHRLLTARPLQMNRAARSGFATARERPNFSALRYFSLRAKRVEHQQEYHISVGLWVPGPRAMLGIVDRLGPEAVSAMPARLWSCRGSTCVRTAIWCCDSRTPGETA